MDEGGRRGTGGGVDWNGPTLGLSVLTRTCEGSNPVSINLPSNNKHQPPQQP